MPKILVTGSSGQLGKEFLTMQGFANIDFVEYDIENYGDITNVQKVDWDISYNIKPNVVINCAAMTDVPGCEMDKAKAMKINVMGPQNLAKMCHANGIPLVHISTDYVFPGFCVDPNYSKSYDEFSNVCPINCYGLTKKLGEDMVRTHCPDHLIIRTAWLYGRFGKSNFFTKILDTAKKNGKLTMTENYGCPTNAKHLMHKVIDLINKNVVGTWHATNMGGCSRLELAKEFFDLMEKHGKLDFPKPDIEICESFPAKVKVAYPKDTRLTSVMDRMYGFESMPNWKEALEEYIKETF